MRLRTRSAVAIAIMTLAALTTVSASGQDKLPTPMPGPMKSAAPGPLKTPAPTRTPKPSASGLKTPTPSPSPTYDHKTAAGFWQETNDQGHVGAWFLFVERNGLYEGRLVKMFRQPNDPPLVLTCSKCTGDQQDAPMLGLTLVKGMKRKGNLYEGGSILDPRDGTVYNAQMELSADGQSLNVRGYLGIPLLGQTQTWTRLPDDSLAPADIPEPSVGPSAQPQPQPQ